MTGKQNKVLAALLACNTAGQAAALAGVSRQSIYKYLACPSFRAQYEEQRRHRVDLAARSLPLKIEAAAQVAAELMENPEVSPSVRLSAAKAVLAYGHKAWEQEEILRRIEALEAAESEPAGGYGSAETRLRALEKRQAGRAAAQYGEDDLAPPRFVIVPAEPGLSLEDDE